MYLRERFKDKKSLIESFFSLSILNGLNVILPLVTLPYILRIIGSSNYGIYAYVYALISYLLLINNYGFNFSATKQIAQNKQDTNRINIIYNSVIACRLLLFIVGAAIFGALSFILLDTADKQFLFIMGLGIVLGDTFNPIWLFQGMEKMRYMTIVNIISKTIFTVLIFVLIRNAEDFRYITLINSCGFILAGVVSTIIAKKQFGISFFIPRQKDIIFQFKEGAALFGTSVGTNLYGNANVFILSFFVSDAMVGVYAAAEKIIKSSQTLTTPILQALFPHISKDFSERDRQYQIAKIKSLSKNIFLLLIIPNIGILLGSKVLIHIFCGTGYEESIMLLRIMSPIFTIGALNYALGIVGLVNMDQQKSFFIGVVIAGLVNVIFLTSTASYWGVYAASVAIPLSEVVLLLICISTLRKISKNERLYG